MKRGEIWSISGAPGYGSKARPALIVQTDIMADTQSIITCGLTSLTLETIPFRPVITPGPDNGLHAPSAIMVDKLTAVPRSKLGQRIGQITPDDMAQVEQAMLLVLGFGG